MESYILERGHVSMEELCGAFGMSLNTVRRDLRELQESGRIVKVYGGVVSNRRDPLLPIEERRARAQSQKRRIGKLAAPCVHDGDVIFIDSGTTTSTLLEELQTVSATVVTASLHVLNRAVQLAGLRLVVLPGTYNPSTDSFSGPETAEAIGRYNISKAFMAASGYSLGDGATIGSPWELNLKQAALRRSRETILMIDSGKFDAVTLLTYAAATEFHTIVTDRRPPAAYTAFFAEHAIRLLTEE
jgi:DeoR family myo-inositol catabolism operon transcriptional repressor